MLTIEQQNVVDLMKSVESDDKIVTVNSVAGSGKSLTAEWVIKTLQPKTGYYTAFNKGIIEEANKKFNKYITVKTIHSLAYSYIKPNRIEDLTYDSIQEPLSYPEKTTIINSLDSFFRSSRISIEDYLHTLDTISDNTKSLIIKYCNLIWEEKIPYTFNALLKKFHLMLHYKAIEIELDLIVLDECQDTTGVTLEIIKLLNSKKKLFLGDKHQNIYEFMETVNAFDVLDNTIELKLTKSFRCNQYIGEIVQEFGKKHLDDNFIFTGNENWLDNNKTEVYLTAYNSSCLYIINDLINENKSFTTLKRIEDIFSMPIAIYNIINSIPITNKKYSYIEKEYYKWKILGCKSSFYTHLLELDIREVALCLNMINELTSKNINIYELKKNLDNYSISKDIIISTVHSFKGLEADTVIIGKDLTDLLKMAELEELLLGKKLDKYKQLYNLYYTALTRAKSKIQYI